MAKQLSLSTTRALTKQLIELSTTKPCEGIAVDFSEENIREIFAEIEGPTGTPFEGGVFRVKLLLGDDFPDTPPKGYFLTKVFHPNISEGGDICVNVLKKDWKADLGIRHVLLVGSAIKFGFMNVIHSARLRHSLDAVRCLLIEPFAESALNEEAGRLLLEDYESFCKRAQLMTRIHATPNKRPMPLATRQATGDSNVNTGSASVSPSKGHPCGSPVMKKAKGQLKSSGQGPSAAAKRRALKRL